MPLRIERDLADAVVQRTRQRLQARARRQQTSGLDVVTWGQRNFYIPETGKPIVFEPFQRAVLLYSFTRNSDGRFPFPLVVLSSIKKTGKTTIASVIGRWIAEDQTRFGEVSTMGNDLKQARERSFEHIKRSIELTPGYRHRGKDGELPERWICQQNTMNCISSGTKIQAVAVDARGEAGGNPDLTIWTELWGFEAQAAVRFFDEMTPVPTKPDSMRLVETYAGFDGESELLRNIYDSGKKEGRQLTAGELTEKTGIPLGCFEEAPNATDLVPIWVDEERGLFMYWDSGLQARRMPWQRGDVGQRYYTQQAANLPPAQNSRLHENEWVGGEGEFVPMEAWNACRQQLPEYLPGDGTPAVLGVDAAVTGDCFGIVLVTRHPERPRDAVMIRKCRKWDPPKGGSIDFEEPEAFLRCLVQGGCYMGHPQYPPFRRPAAECDHATPLTRACVDCCAACRDNALVPPHNILQIAYDKYQLESMMQKFRREGLTWCEQFDQGNERLVGDSMFRHLIMERRLAHDGNDDLRQHVQNSASRISKDEDNKLRIVKREGGRKIDLTVAASMASYRCLYLII